MDALEEYHKITLLVANFVPAGSVRPMHIANHTKLANARLAHLFELLDDDTIGLTALAHTVGAHTTDDEDARVIVI
jgi:hypothetical protein